MDRQYCKKTDQKYFYKMADKKISALPASTTPIPRNTPLPGVISGVTEKITIEDLSGEYDTGFILITSAELLLLQTAPILMVAPPGAGYYLRILRTDVFNDYGTTPYAASDIPALYYDTANKPAFAFPKILQSTVNTGEMGVLQDLVLATNTIMLENKGIYLKPFSGANPTLGNSDVNIRIRYEKVAMP